nr:DinB superfamily [uncultured bacterium]
MDEHRTGSSMLDGTDFVTRLDSVEQRLDEHASAEAPTGLTDPDPGGTEQWEAGQVWAHMAEFVGYWRGQAESVIAAYDGDAVPFGRLKDDPGRMAGIEMGRHEAVRQSRNRVREEIAEMKTYLSTLTAAEWNAVGQHPTRGQMDVEAIVGTFIVNHLEEHAATLDKLAQEAETKA